MKIFLLDLTNISKKLKCYKIDHSTAFPLNNLYYSCKDPCGHVFNPISVIARKILDTHIGSRNPKIIFCYKWYQRWCDP